MCKRTNITTFIFIVVLITAVICSCKNSESQYLEHIEELSNSNPLKAKECIDSLVHEFSSAKESDKMKYQLLKYKIEDKCFIVHSSDTLIRKICDYYEHEGTKHDKLEAYYYMGCTYRDMQRYPLAVTWYEKALDISTDMDLSYSDSLVLMTIYGQDAGINFDLGLHQDAYRLMQQSFEIRKALWCQDIWSYQDMGRMAAAVDSTNQAMTLYQKAYLDIMNKNAVKEYVDFIGEQLGFYIEKKNRSLAELLFHTLKEVGTDSLPSNAISSMAHYFMDIECKTDSAVIYYEKAYSCSRSLQQRTWLTKKLSKAFLSIGNIDKSLHYVNLFLSLQDSLQLEQKKKDIEVAQTYYLLQNLRETQQQKKETRYRQEIYLFILLSVVFLCIGIVCAALYINSRKKLKWEQQLNALAEQKKEVETEHQKLKEEVHIERKLRAESSADVSSVIQQLNDIADSPKEKLKEDSWDVIFNTVDKLHPNFRKQLFTFSSDLQNKDLLIIYLVKMGYKQADIARITKRARSVVNRKYHRIESLLGASINDIVSETE